MPQLAVAVAVAVASSWRSLFELVAHINYVDPSLMGCRLRVPQRLVVIKRVEAGAESQVVVQHCGAWREGLDHISSVLRLWALSGCQSALISLSIIDYRAKARLFADFTTIISTCLADFMDFCTGAGESHARAFMNTRSNMQLNTHKSDIIVSLCCRASKQPNRKRQIKRERAATEPTGVTAKPQSHPQRHMPWLSEGEEWSS